MRKNIENSLHIQNKLNNYKASLVSIYDYLKLVDKEIITNDIKIDMLELNDETLSEMLFRKLKGYNIDLNKELGWNHLKPITKTQNKDE